MHPRIVFFLLLATSASLLNTTEGRKPSRAERYRPEMLSENSKKADSTIDEEHATASLLRAGPAKPNPRRHGKKSTSENGKSRHYTQDPSVELDLQDILSTLKALGLAESQYSKPSAQFMLSLYERLQSGDNLAAAAGHDHLDVAILQADTVRSFPAEVPEQAQKVELSLKFNLTKLTTREVLSKAELRLKKQNHHHEDVRFQLKMKIQREDGQGSRMSYRVKTWRETMDGFIILDITPILSALLAPGYANCTVEISIRSRSVSKRQTRSTVDEALEDAMLVTFTQDKSFFREFQKGQARWNKRVELDNHPEAGPFARLEQPADTAEHSRIKRRSGKKDRKNSKEDNTEAGEQTQNLCNKHPFYVDFEVIGWSQWIVYPKSFNAYQCSGKCPSPVGPEFQPTNHAILQSLMRIHDKEVSRPCCVPTKLAPISMLYYEYDEIVVRHHEDMIVDRCGCR